jgi:hypothetical protein
MYIWRERERERERERYDREPEGAPRHKKKGGGGPVVVLPRGCWGPPEAVASATKLRTYSANNTYVHFSDFSDFFESV